MGLSLIRLPLIIDGDPNEYKDWVTDVVREGISSVNWDWSADIIFDFKPHTVIKLF